MALLALLAAAPAHAARPQVAPLRVGSSAVNLAADDKMQIAGGIDPSYAQGQEGELRAVATVIEQPGSGKIAIVGCDVLFVTREMIDRCAALVEKSCGIEPAHLLVNATHTHHAPATVRIHGCQAEPEFVRTLEAGIVKAVEEANAHLVDNCRMSFCLLEEPGIGQNSRLLLADGMINWIGSSVPIVRPTGPFDPQLPVLSFRDPAAKLVSVIYNHSTHTIGTLHRAMSARRRSMGWRLRSWRETGRADHVPRRGLGLDAQPELFLVQSAIEKLKADISKGSRKSGRADASQLMAIKRPFRFKVRTFDEQTEDKKVIDYCTKHAPGALDMCIRVFRQSRLELKGEQGKERESSVQVILIGDVALVGVSGEFFTGLGMEIKKRSPFKQTYVAELANDWIGYLPDREAFQLGGYQTWTGTHCFAEIGTGERMVDQAVAMLEELAGVLAGSKHGARTPESVVSPSPKSTDGRLGTTGAIHAPATMIGLEHNYDLENC